MSKFELVKCDDNQLWDEFVYKSPQNNIFCQVSFLVSLGIDYDLWFVTKNKNPCLAAVILKDSNGEPIRAPFSFSLYQGVLFSSRHSTLQVHQSVAESFHLIDFLLSELEKLYSRISFCLHPKVDDVRSFSWFNYHEAEKGKFTINVYYSGIIDLRNTTNFDSYLASIRKTRRYEYRKSYKDKLSVEISTDIDLLEKLYIRTFERQNISVDLSVLKTMKNIAESALAKDYGRLCVCRNEKGEALSASLFLHDNMTCYYLIGANNPDFRQAGSGIFLVLENIRHYIQLGYQFVDVCGLNSPNRGDFKSSLNAKPLPYYVTTWEKPPE